MSAVEKAVQAIETVRALGRSAIIWLSEYRGQGLYYESFASIALPEEQKSINLAVTERVQLEEILTAEHSHTTLAKEESIYGHHGHWWSETTIPAVAWHYAFWSYECAGAASHFLVVNLPLGDFQDATRLPDIAKGVLARKSKDAIEAETKSQEARRILDLLVRLSERQRVDSLVISDIERSWKGSRLTHLLNGYLHWYFFEYKGEPDALLNELEVLAYDLRADPNSFRSYFCVAASQRIDRLKRKLEYRPPYDWCPAEIFFIPLDSGQQKQKLEMACKRFETEIAKVEGWLALGGCTPLLKRQLTEVAQGFRSHLERGHRCFGKKSFWQKLFNS